MAAQSIVRKHFMPGLAGLNILLLAGAALALSLAAHAQSAAPSPESPNSPPSQMAPTGATGAGGGIPANKLTSRDVEDAFKRADVDHDGKLTRQEAEHFPVVAQQFEQIDLNRDRFISLDEFNKAAGS